MIWSVSSYFVSDVLSHSFSLFFHLAMFLFSLFFFLSSCFSDCGLHFRIITVIDQSAVSRTCRWTTFTLLRWDQSKRTVVDKGNNVTQLKTSTHKSAMTDTDNVFVPRDRDLWPFDSNINCFPGLTVDHVYVKFGDPLCIGFWDIVWKNRHRQTNKQTNKPTHRRRWKLHPRDSRRRG